MKIIHTSDIHLYSPLSSKLPPMAAKTRRRELLSTLSRLCEEAVRINAEAVIIAGDLFDSERVGHREAETVLGFFEKAKGVRFFYLPGNHETDALMRSGARIPENLMLFGKEWTYFELNGVTFAGRSETDEGMFDSLSLSEDTVNITVLHGELRDRSHEGGVIGIRDAGDRRIDYLALGHYHTYSATVIDGRGIAVYSGTPEGRGFDETGELGYSLITVDEGLTHKFVSFAKRRIIEYDVDISNAESATEVLSLIEKGSHGINRDYIVRARLIGGRGVDLRYDVSFIEEAMEDKFFYFEIKDKSRITARAEDFLNDKSLKGEFIRLALSDEELDDITRSEVISIGLSALRGEEID